jgi:hypothetical protein
VNFQPMVLRDQSGGCVVGQKPVCLDLGRQCQRLRLTEIQNPRFNPLIGRSLGGWAELNNFNADKVLWFLKTPGEELGANGSRYM